jgi:predicted nucleic acid-binding Zn ribbon protein
MAEISEASRTYQHFRELFGGDRPRPRANRRAPRAGSEPFTPGRDPKPIADTIDVLSGELGWSAPLSQSDLLSSWAEVAGEETAKHSEPIAIEKGMLQVRCESTAWATQLRMMRTQLIARIAEQYPDAGVETIRFQGPDAPTWKYGPRSVPGRGPRDTYG